MPNRNHLRIIAERQLSETGRVKFNYGFGENDSDANREPDYFFMARTFRDDLHSYRNDLELKAASKDETINVPYDVDYVEVDFMGQFHLQKYYSIWYNTFGLEGVSFTNYNRTALFSISDRDKFQLFITSIEGLINRGIEGNLEANFNKNVLFVKNFKLLTISDVLKVNAESLGNVVVLKTIELPANQEVENAIIQALIDYLEDHILEYKLDRITNRLEIYNATLAELTAIAQNFDIIESITSSLSGVIRPGEYNVATRGFGFEIVNANEDLPLIGILDTGVSMQTPLAGIILEDDSFTLAGNPLIDDGGREGHGTISAALAALGRRNHINNFEGEITADAKILSMKLLGGARGYFSEKGVIDMLYEAKRKYPHIGIFVLTICYIAHKRTNETFSNYTYELDKFAHDTNSLIFISIGNNPQSMVENTNYDLNYFNSEHSNLNTPADSMNNVTVGAAADGLYDGVFNGISLGKEFPTIYSRTDHIDLAAIYSTRKRNKNLFKPDIIESGGDYGFYNPTTIDRMDNAAMTVMSSNPALGYTKQVGTSLAAPLAANLAAQLKIAYPDLKAQTLKALIINGASLKNTAYPDTYKSLLNRTAGYGLIDVDRTIFSNENNATMVLEDTIQSGEQRLYPINFPDYLISTDLGKTSRILKITGTLCFSFLPLQHNQLTYCPLHIAFSVFRNHSSDDINRVQTELNSKLRSTLTWSQSARDKATPAPYSNVQKIEFNVDVSQLRTEDKTFKLAVQALLSNQIMASQIENYPTEFDFSIVLKIEETVRTQTGRLYDELRAVNNVEVINVAEAEAEADLDGEV